MAQYKWAIRRSDSDGALSRGATRVVESVYNSRIEQEPSFYAICEPVMKLCREAQFFERARREFVLAGQHTEYSPLI